MSRVKSKQGHLTVQYNLRWTEEMRDRITKSAAENTRSMNQEINARLEKSYSLAECVSLRDASTVELINELSFRFGGVQISVEALKK